MHILIADLHKNAACIGQKFPCKQQPVPQITEIRMDAKLPCIPESFDHFRFLRQVFVFFILDIPFIHKRLKV